MNLLLIITAILLFAGFAIGWARGLFGILAGVLSWVIILVVMYAVTPVIEKAYMKGPVYDKMYDLVSANVSDGLIRKENKSIDKINEAIENGNDDQDQDSETVGQNRKAKTDLGDSESMKDFLSELHIPLPETVTGIVSRAVDTATNAAAEIANNISADSESKLSGANDTIIKDVSEPIAKLMVRGVALITALIIALILTRIVALIAQIAGDMPVVGGISGFFGGIWGMVVALILVWIFMDLVSCFSITSQGQKLLDMINSSGFLDALYINNPLGFLISR